MLLRIDCIGGKRDPEDADDRITAERETREEVGLTLTPNNSIYCGGLDQRLVSTSGSTVPLMTLCPYGTLDMNLTDEVYILTSPTMPTLHLQPSEVFP
jgi:8-oxo-dGTP pyrophosphatase MutT (NUDIX family)